MINTSYKLNILKENYIIHHFTNVLVKINNIVFYADIIRRIPRLALEVLAVFFLSLISLYYFSIDKNNIELALNHANKAKQINPNHISSKQMLRMIKNNDYK